MDRRRYIPSADGLERREMLSTTSTSLVSATAATAPTGTQPGNFGEKEKRIANLPYFLENMQPGRYLPPATIKSIQADLLAVAANLHEAPSSALNNFNMTLRHAMPYSTLSPNTAKLLNHAFTATIASSGMAPSYVQSLSDAMNQLALVDSKSIDPSYLARNDYALVLQTTLAVGRPIETPTRPTISPQSGKAANGYQAYTYKANPLLVGTYIAGASSDGSTVMEVFNGGQVIAMGAVQSNGRYSAPVATPLAPGTYKLEVRAVDSLGHISKPSKPLVLKVSAHPGATNAQAQTLTVTATPGGPLGLSGRGA